MKKIIAFLFIISLVSADLFAQSWQWAASDGSNQSEATVSLCTDVYGNIYTSGYFGDGPGITYFGVFAGDTLYMQGETDIFVASYGPSGSGKWAKRAGTDSFGPNYLLETGYLHSNKSDSSLLLYGFYAGDFSIDTFLLPGTPNSEDIFISKLNYQGDCMWIKKAINLPGGGSLFSMSSDQSSNNYMIGTSASGIVLDTFNVASGIFAARINSDGDFLWAKKITDILQTSNWQITATSFGFIASGVFINSTILDTIPLTSQGSNDIFIASFDSLGSVQWAKRFGGPNFEFKSRLSLDAVGNIYTTAYFTDSIYFDTTLLTHPGKDVFLAKFDPSGNFLWARQLHASGNAESYDIDADVDGNVYITGFFSQSATFGSHTLTPANYSMFLARYNSQGDCLGVRHFESAIGTNVLSDQGSVIVSGTFADSVSLGNNTIISNGLSDMFIARHDAFTGVGEFQGLRKSSLFIYANPSNGKCTITIPEEFQYESNLVLSILGRNGRTIKEYPIGIHDGKIRLNLEAEAKGIYIARLSNGVKQYTGKIVFE